MLFQLLEEEPFFWVVVIHYVYYVAKLGITCLISQVYITSNKDKICDEKNNFTIKQMGTLR